MSTRGERNNNPGNIRRGANWQGLAPDQPDAAFCTFIDARWGIRALAKIMLTYRDKGLHTVQTIINRWAPPTENNTAAYVAAVAADIGVDADHPLDAGKYADLYPLVCAIIHHENGRNVYMRQTIDAGLALAGVVP
jgi:hypothetical protein